jgi:hypothetical protein
MDLKEKSKITGVSARMNLGQKQSIQDADSLPQWTDYSPQHSYSAIKQFFIPEPPRKRVHLKNETRRLF